MHGQSQPLIIGNHVQPRPARDQNVPGSPLLSQNTIILNEARFLLVLWSNLCGFPFDHKSRSCIGSKTILLHCTFQRWISMPPSNNQTLHGYSFIKMNSFGSKMYVILKRLHPIPAVPTISTDVSNNGSYLSRYVQSTKYLVLARLHPWSYPSSCLLYNDRSFYNLSRVPYCHQPRWQPPTSTHHKSSSSSSYTSLN